MSTDKRTLINDCENNTGWTGDDTANAIATAGSFIQGSGALSTQLSNADEQMSTTRDTVGASTFSLDWSDSTLYMNIKDKLGDSFANGGAQFVIGDGSVLTGYDIAGNDAVGMPYALFFAAYKLDVSVVVATPGSFTDFTGSEVNLDQTVATEIGFGSLHLAKAVGSIDNVLMDGFYHIANGTYALNINGGTVGTPETMTDVAADDITDGWGLVFNPFGTQYIFFGPTEWGEAASAADHFFEATGEQWFWMGDNAGGHEIGPGNFPFRVVGNSTDTGSFVITNVAIVNTGSAAPFDVSSADIDTMEINGCSFLGLASFAGPSTGGTSRECLNTVFASCGEITHNGAPMNGCSVIDSTVAANGNAIFYDEAVDPDGEMDDMTFVQGAAAHHGMTFGAGIPASITIRGADFTGFSSSDDNDGSVFKFEDTTGTITLNLVGCSNDGSGFSIDSRAGCTVVVVIDPVTTLVHVNDDLGDDLQSARVYLQASNGVGDLPFEDVVTITRSGAVATVSHTGHNLATGNRVKILGITDKTKDNNGTHVITFISSSSYSFVTIDEGSTTYTGTITATGVIIDGDTDSGGDVSDNRTFTTAQAVSGRVRKGSASPFFKNFPISGSISATVGLTITVQMVSDE